MGHRAGDGLRDSPDYDFLGCSRSPTIGFRSLLIIKVNVENPFRYTYFFFTLIFPLSLTYSLIFSQFVVLFSPSWIPLSILRISAYCSLLSFSLYIPHLFHYAIDEIMKSIIWSAPVRPKNRRSSNEQISTFDIYNCTRITNSIPFCHLCILCLTIITFTDLYRHQPLWTRPPSPEPELLIPLQQ